VPGDNRHTGKPAPLIEAINVQRALPSGFTLSAERHRLTQLRMGIAKLAQMLHVDHPALAVTGNENAPLKFKALYLDNGWEELLEAVYRRAAYLNSPVHALTKRARKPSL